MKRCEGARPGEGRESGDIGRERVRERARERERERGVGHVSAERRRAAPCARPARPFGGLHAGAVAQDGRRLGLTRIGLAPVASHHSSTRIDSDRIGAFGVAPFVNGDVIEAAPLPHRLGDLQEERTPSDQRCARSKPAGPLHRVTWIELPNFRITFKRSNMMRHRSS